MHDARARRRRARPHVASPFATPALAIARAHTIAVRAIDAAANTGTAAVTFTVSAVTALAARPVQLVSTYTRRSTTLSATLSYALTGAPARGRLIAFTAAGRQACTAVTDAGGAATCDAVVAGSRLVPEYDATFAGDPQFTAATSRAGLAAGTAKTTVKAPRGARLLKAELRNSKGKRVRRLPTLGRRAYVDLEELSAGRYSVRVTVRRNNGKPRTIKHRLTACRPG